MCDRSSQCKSFKVLLTGLVRIDKVHCNKIYGYDRLAVHVVLSVGSAKVRKCDDEMEAADHMRSCRIADESKRQHRAIGIYCAGEKLSN